MDLLVLRLVQLCRSRYGAAGEAVGGTRCTVRERRAQVTHSWSSWDHVQQAEQLPSAERSSFTNVLRVLVGLEKKRQPV